MNRSYLLFPFLLIFIFVMTVVFIAWKFVSAPDPSYEIEPSSSSESLGVENTAGNQQEIIMLTGVRTKEGLIKQTRDFLKDGDVKIWDETSGVYLLDEEIGSNGLPVYQTLYFNDGSIVISLQDENLNFTRSQAERALSIRLGIIGDELCDLDVSVTTPSNINENLSGQNLGLSLCSNAINLP